MTKAPERIWAWSEDDDFMRAKEHGVEHATQYTRSDLHADLIKAADELAEAVKTALDYASDASKGYLWHETKKDGHDALARLSADTGKDDVDNFNSALTAYQQAKEKLNG